MQTFEGIAVSPGVAIGEAFIFDNEGFRIPNRFVSRSAVDDEIRTQSPMLLRVAKMIEQTGNKELALKNYKKALELNPKSTSAKQAINRIEGKAPRRFLLS